ncbi:MAG: MarR family transcriptional regulator [Robiginitomaculum sp.]|nr:MAG: MarR family transcriptional regulator [Robiginitomaculum sp.]
MTIARPVDRRLFLLLDRARHKLFKRANIKLQAEIGISAVQGGALFFLGRHRDCLLSDLAEGLALNNSAITGLAARMEKAGLIERTRCKFDGRAWRISLTADGEAKRVLVTEQLRTFNSEISTGFSETEMDIVYRFLSQVAEVETFTK